MNKVFYYIKNRGVENSNYTEILYVKEGNYFDMKTFCGTDIIEIERIQGSIEKFGKSFIQRVFTQNEIAYCESKNSMKYQHYAARFAAKEAALKAVSKAVKDKYSLNWKNIEIQNDINGRPSIHFIDFNIERLKYIDISISHCKNYAIAMVVAEMEE